MKNIRHLLPPRNPKSHKGDFGRILILAGSVGMSGAAVLAGTAALRSGAGLVTVGVPEGLSLVMAKRLTEAMFLPLPETKSGTLSARAFSKIKTFLKNQNVFAVGPGLSQNPETQKLIRRAVLASKIPVVLDADGLNAFVGKAARFRKLKAPLIATPHPGEFHRLFKVSVPGDLKGRILIAKKISQQYRLTLVLKGNQTVVADQSGRAFVNSTGNAGMATGGSGDVLTGVIAALLGQKLKPFDAACAGVYVHGLAGDFAVKKQGQISLIASDIIQYLPQVFRKLAG